MKLCLVKPPTFQAPGSLSYFGSVPSLGLAYVAAAARDAGHELQVIDAPGEAITRYGPYRTALGDMLMHGLSQDEIVERIDPDTEVVAFTNLFLHEWPFLRDTVKEVKSALPRATTVIGGETPTAWWSHMLSTCREIDVCVLGEGEETLVELMSALDSGQSLDGVASLAFRSNGSSTRTAPRPRIKSVGDIAWPAWDLFPLERYLEHELGSGVNRGRPIPMLTSRGCPYQCTFCSSPLMWTTRYYAREPEDVADEIQLYQERYAVTNVNFNDLTSILTKDWIVKFCQVIQARKLEFSWQLPSGTRSEAVDHEAAELLYESGCRNFCYAPESGSPRTLKSIKKKVKLASLLESLRGSLDAGLNTQSSIIIGFPDEGIRDLWLTYKLIVKLAWMGLHTLSVMIFTPYPGSELYEKLKAEGRIEVDDAYIYSTLLRSGASRKSYSDRLGTRTLVAIQFFFLLSFYGLQYAFRPLRIWQVLKNLLRSKQENVMEQFLAAKLKQLRKRA